MYNALFIPTLSDDLCMPLSSAFSYSHTYESVTVDNVDWYKCITKIGAKNSHR